MAEYLAVIRMTPHSGPSKVQFSADNVKEAINKILNITQCGSTVNIHEYEVLEVVQGGYKPVAVKECPKGTVVGQVVVADFAVRPVPPAAETPYQPYTVTTT